MDRDGQASNLCVLLSYCCCIVGSSCVGIPQEIIVWQIDNLTMFNVNIPPPHGSPWMSLPMLKVSPLPPPPTPSAKRSHAMQISWEKYFTWNPLLSLENLGFIISSCQKKIHLVYLWPTLILRPLKHVKKGLWPDISPLFCLVWRNWFICGGL